ncbi:SDR family oxidoreductase [Pseudonocardia sp.]|uniref:SDR family NAD(P)-dependent oxidoreductase n=1 Tax=Pseudonocardia sp. TaxID=60912 RepID=UPI002631E792|nr:SDR family oxidoreductase [Pseudonocardia sp.]
MRRDPDLPDLTGTVALVTGAGGGIGSGIALRFAAAGAAVVVGYRSSAGRADAVVAQILGDGGRAAAVRADVTGPEGCAALVAAAVGGFGRLDAVVAAAGVQPVAEIAGTSVADWRGVVDTNLTGTFATVRAAAAAMTGGSITVIASIEGGRPAPAHAHYAASKAGVIMLARSAALEFGPRGIRVNSVSPGLVARAGLDAEWPSGVARWRATSPLGELVSAAEVGDACVFLASPMARRITGHDLVVDGGMGVAPPW